MASFTAPSPASAITRATFVPKGAVAVAVAVLSSPVLAAVVRPEGFRMTHRIRGDEYVWKIFVPPRLCGSLVWISLFCGSLPRRRSGLPRIGVRSGGVRCSASSPEKLSAASALAAGLMASVSGPALALVDERLSTEGTGLPFGLSNNLLGWILFGVFGLIWSLYFVYATTLDEDDDSGLSL